MLFRVVRVKLRDVLLDLTDGVYLIHAHYFPFYLKNVNEKFVLPFAWYPWFRMFRKKLFSRATNHGMRVKTMDALVMPCRLRCVTTLVVCTLLRLAFRNSWGSLFRIVVHRKMMKHVKHDMWVYFLRVRIRVSFA